MKAKLTIIVLLCFITFGCVEPYPTFDVQKASTTEVPDRVLAAYLRKCPDARLLEIERSVLTSRFQGYPKCWRFQYEEKTKETKTVVFDNKGNEVEFDNWFPEKQ